MIVYYIIKMFLEQCMDGLIVLLLVVIDVVFKEKEKFVQKVF